MGYAVLHLEKASGNDTAMSAHIERKTKPANANVELTYLNEEQVEFPEGVNNRTEAIQHRLDHAGVTRKIGTNQVRAVRVLLTGTHADMKRIQEEGRLKEWCSDNLAYLRETFGADNVVSAVLHMDEKTPHLHATVVPIVTGQRRKAKQTPKKKTGKLYRKKAESAPRLCADDLMSRTNLKKFQDTYAKSMEKYGLSRGIEGSKARHVSTSQYYRELIDQTESLQTNIENLLEIEQASKKSIVQLERKRERTEQAHRETVQEFQKEISSLKKQLESGKESIEKTDREISQKQHTLRYIEDQITHANRKDLIGIVENMRTYFPLAVELGMYVPELRKFGLNENHIVELFKGQPLVFNGNLFWPSTGQTIPANNVILSMKKFNELPALTINNRHFNRWFRENDTARKEQPQGLQNKPMTPESQTLPSKPVNTHAKAIGNEQRPEEKQTFFDTPTAQRPQALQIKPNQPQGLQNKANSGQFNIDDYLTETHSISAPQTLHNKEKQPQDLPNKPKRENRDIMEMIYGTPIKPGSKNDPSTNTEIQVPSAPVNRIRKGVKR